LELSRSIASAESLTDLDAYRIELKACLNKAVDALDIDEVSDEGFQSFAFLWQTAERELDDKATQLRQEKKQPSQKPIAAE